MIRARIGLALALLSLAGCTSSPPPPAPPTPRERIEAAVAAIRAIDSHAHAPSPTPEGVAPEAALDRLGIEIRLIQSPARVAGLAPPRFRWVAGFDPVLFPLAFSKASLADSELRARFEATLAELGIPGRPPSLAAYLGGVIAPALERAKADGAVAISLELARPVRLAAVPRRRAEATYARFALHGKPAAEDDAALACWLVHALAKEAAEQGLALQIQVDRGATPEQLARLVDSPELARARFALVHGGYAHDHVLAALADRKNVWIDLSRHAATLPVRALADSLRIWLALAPERITFGTDAADPEAAARANAGFRRALVLELAEQVESGELETERAIALAERVLRENALALYALPALPR